MLNHTYQRANIFEKLFFIIAAILIFASVYIIINENLVLFLFEENLKYEATRFIIEILNGWSNSIADVTGYNSKDLNDVYECKRTIILWELSMINFIYGCILAIIFKEYSCKTK